MLLIRSGAKCAANNGEYGRKSNGESDVESGRTITMLRVLPMLMLKHFKVGRLGKPELW